MRVVIPDRLWIGNAMDARDPARLHELGIAALVDLAIEELPPQLSREMICCRFPVVDGAGNAGGLLSAAIQTTARLVHEKVPTLVSCSGGMSRSPAIVAAALGLVRNEGPDTSVQQLVAAGPHDVSPPLWADVRRAFEGLAG